MSVARSSSGGGCAPPLLGRISKLNLAGHESVYNARQLLTLLSTAYWSRPRGIQTAFSHKRSQFFVFRVRIFANLVSPVIMTFDLHENVSCFPAILAVWDCFVHKTHFTDSVINFPNSRLLTPGVTPWWSYQINADFYKQTMFAALSPSSSQCNVLSPSASPTSIAKFIQKLKRIDWF